MRRTLISASFLLLGSMLAFGQNDAAKDARDLHQDRRDIRHDRRDIRHDRRDIRQDDRDLNVELYVNKGRGYVEADQHPVDRGLPVDLVRVDSIYNPVRRANFTVAETRVLPEDLETTWRRMREAFAEVGG